MENEEIVLSDNSDVYKSIFKKFGIKGGLTEEECDRFCRVLFSISDNSSLCEEVDEIDLTNSELTNGLDLLTNPTSVEEALQYYNIAKPVIDRLFMKYNVKISELKVVYSDLDTRIATLRAELSNLKHEKIGIESALSYYNSVVKELSK